jgi:phospholipase/carboxylesterase
MMNEPQLMTSSGWTFRWLPARKKPPRLLVLVHGLTGDENSMWMLVQHFPPDYSIMAPRAPYPASESGYTWRKEAPGSQGFPSDNDLIPAATAFWEFLETWRRSNGFENEPFDLMGFSQGAAMVYLLSLLQPERIRKMAALSGFIPRGLETDGSGKGLVGKQIFVAHGRQDELVPVEMAQKSVAMLKEWGARVTYCESDAGHKVSRECLHSLEKFFEEK